MNKLKYDLDNLPFDPAVEAMKASEASRPLRAEFLEGGTEDDRYGTEADFRRDAALRVARALHQSRALMGQSRELSQSQKNLLNKIEFG